MQYLIFSPFRLQGSPTFVATAYAVITPAAAHFFISLIVAPMPSGGYVVANCRNFIKNLYRCNNMTSL